MATQAAGTLVGAVLESVGYYYQSAILDALAAPFANEVGGLIYLVGVLVAVFTAATQGSFKMTTWLLIGPPIFFAVVQPRSVIPDARWEFGLNERNSAEVSEGVQEIINAAQNGNAQANVSTVFRRYVEMISQSMREVVGLIVKNRTGGDRALVLRGELYSLLHTAKIGDKNLSLLMHQSLLGDCGQVIDLAMESGDYLHRDGESEKSAAVEGNESGQEATEETAAMQSGAENEFSVKYHIKDKNLSPSVAEHVIGVLANRATVNGQPLTEAQQQALRDQMTDQKAALENRAISCADIWSYTWHSLLELGEQHLDAVFRKGVELGLDEKIQANLALQMRGLADGPVSVTDEDRADTNPTPAQIDALVRLVAKAALRNEVSARDKAARVAHFATRIDVKRVATRVQGKNSLIEEFRLTASEWGERERLMHAASSLPYYQGLLLYFLGTTFPFFALLLLVPGKQAGFLLWFLLWLWVKSWDVGMAVVVVLDDLLFSLFAVQSKTSGQTFTDPANSQIEFAFATLREMDPTFQLTTYYTVIATVVLAIPVTSAQLILGGVKGGASIVADGANTSSQFFGDRTTTNVEQQKISGLRQQVRALKSQRGKSALPAINRGDQARSTMEKDAAAADAPTAPETGVRPNVKGNNAPNESNAGRIPKANGKKPTRDEQTKSARDAATSGAFADGLSGPNSPFKGRNSLGLNNILSAATAGRFKSKAFAKYEQRLMGTGHAASAAEISWLTDIDQEVIELQEKIGLARGIPIPWSNFAEENSQSNYDHIMEQYKALEGFKEADAEVLGTVLGEVNSYRKTILGRLSSMDNSPVDASVPFSAQPAAVQKQVNTIFSNQYAPQLLRRLRNERSMLARGGLGAGATAVSLGIFTEQEYAQNQVGAKLAAEVSPRITDPELEFAQTGMRATRDKGPNVTAMGEGNRVATIKE